MLYSRKYNLNVSLGTQRRTIINVNDSFKTVVKGVVSENEIKLAADKMADDMIEVIVFTIFSGDSGECQVVK